MDLHASNLVPHIKRVACSSIRLGYQYAWDYPVILGAGISLLVLHRLCPSLFMFLLSSSPVFLLTALLLGALLTYGEPCDPVVVEEETLGHQQILSPESKSFGADCSSAEEIENVDVVAYAEKSFGSQVVCTKERTFDSIVDDVHHDEEKTTSMSTDTILCAEDFSEIASKNVVVETEEQWQQQESLLLTSNVIVETEDQTEQISENVELQEFENANTESCHNRYQLGELMSSCWQPVMRQEDPCSDSESDISGSSSDASMTDIIPMLDELNPAMNLEGCRHPSSTLRDSLNSSSDDEDGSEEDGDLGSDEDGGSKKNGDENDSVDNNGVDSSDTEKGSNVNSLMERRRTKNMLKFELDKMLVDMQAAADATQKMEAASHFRVQVPSISTPRPKPFDTSNGSEETIELPKIPDSAPSILLASKRTFDIPFDQIMDRGRKLQQTWTPRSYFPSTQHREHVNLDQWQFSYLQQHNSVMAKKHELGSRSDSCESRSEDSDSGQTGNNGKLFGSLEAHIGEEIKIVSAAISDVCVLEANCEVEEGMEQLTVHSLSKGNNSEQHIVQADSISEVNLLFKSRMEEVLVQSVSESGISQPVLTVKHEAELCSTLSSADSEMPAALEASSVEESNSRISRLTKETPAAWAASDETCDNEELVQDISSAALPTENGHSSHLPIEDGHDSDSAVDDPTTDVRFEGKPNELFSDNAELPVVEESSAQAMNSSFKKTEEEVQDQVYPVSVHNNSGEDEGDASSDTLLVVEAKSIEDISSAFVQLRNGRDMKLPQNITITTTTNDDDDDQENQIQGTSGGATSGI